MKSFKTELDLNNRQRTLCVKHAGVARHAWNWGLEECKKALNAGELCPSAITLHKRLNAEVKPEFAWYYEVSKCAPQQALRNLEVAWKRCFKKISKQPRRKKKNKKADSFYLEGNIQISGNKIKLPKIGWVRTHEVLPEGAGPKNCVISKRANKWFVSFKMSCTTKHTPKIREKIGVDLGINKLATLSDGTYFENPCAFTRNQKKLRRISKELSRRTKGSKNKEKTKAKLSRLHYRIACIRNDNLHKITSYLAKNHSLIAIEDLNVRGMMKNRRLAKSIADCGLYEFRRQLEYKSSWYGSTVVLCNRWFPSSKTCSCCGHVKDSLYLHERIFKCESCGISLDRDLNAAKNIEQAASSAVSVCGASVRPDLGLAVCEKPNRCKALGKKQKLNTNPREQV